MNQIEEMIQAKEKSQARMFRPFSGNNKTFCNSWTQAVHGEVRMVARVMDDETEEGLIERGILSQAKEL